MNNSRHLTTLNLEPFLRNAIGMNHVFENMMNRVEHSNRGNYPPYNIIAIDDDHFRIEVAVAGFAKEEVKVIVDNGQLSIRGFQETITEADEEIPDANITYLHQGISARSFERTFTLADHVEVTDAGVVDGVLKVELERNIPESLKPKEIEVK